MNKLYYHKHAKILFLWPFACRIKSLALAIIIISRQSPSDDWLQILFRNYFWIFLAASDEENQSGHSSDRDPTMDPDAANSKDPRTSTAIVPIKIFPPLARNALDFLPDREERTQKK